MFIIPRCFQLSLISGSLLLRHTKPTLRPIDTRRLYSPNRLCRTTWSDSRRGVSTQSPGTVIPFGEESLPDYEAEQFYPVNIGDTINSRYHVIGKLGYGANSTGWFCRDLLYGSGYYGNPLVELADSDKYVVSKVYVRTQPGRVNRGKSFYSHVHTLCTAHPGSQYIRHVIDQFSLIHTSGDVHECLVHRPLQATLFAFQRPGGTSRPLPEELVKSIMKTLPGVLDFLHTEANVTHCGTSPAATHDTSALTCVTQV
jgi:serine/threonine-protein kinase SRPK3